MRFDGPSPRGDGGARTALHAPFVQLQVTVELQNLPARSLQITRTVWELQAEPLRSREGSRGLGLARPATDGRTEAVGNSTPRTARTETPRAPGPARERMGCSRVHLRVAVCAAASPTGTPGTFLPASFPLPHFLVYEPLSLLRPPDVLRGPGS